jgi:hypothetical protein
MVDHGIFGHEIELMNVSGAESNFLLDFLNDRTQFVCERHSEHDIQNRHKPTIGFSGLTYDVQYICKKNLPMQL